MLAAIHISDTSAEVLKALVEIDGELIYLSHDEDPAQCELRVPIDFSVADEAERDLSPLYLDMDEPRPVIQHHEVPWVAVQRSPHLVEVIDIATGAVPHRVSTT